MMEIAVLVIALVSVIYLIASKPSKNIEQAVRDYERHVRYGYLEEILDIVNNIDPRELSTLMDAGYLPPKTKSVVGVTNKQRHDSI